MLKNKIIAIILACMLLSPVIAEETDTAMPADEREILETVYPQAAESEVVNNTEEATAQTEQKQIAEPQIPHKQPISKRKIAKKFLLAMLGVGISSVLIFGILTIYNKVREGFMTGEDLPEDKKVTSLETPDTLTDAVKTFLDKTKWE